jgi:hypothetical protein
MFFEKSNDLAAGYNPRDNVYIKMYTCVLFFNNMI